MAIDLAVRRFLDLEALEHGLTIFSFRLLAYVQFQMRLWVLLADGEVPIVLGCHGFLDRARLTLNGPRHLASLDF